MKYIAAISALFALKVLANPLAIAPRVSVIDPSVLKWEIDAENGEVIAVNGTIENVIHHLQQRGLPSSDTLQKRIPPLDMTGTHYFCGGRWDRAELSPLYRGLTYLNTVKGRVHVPRGPSSCGRVSCDDSSAIYICNDNRYPLTLDTFDRIVEAASYIISKCTIVKPLVQVSGQLFFPDNWNVIVRWDNDC
ncbi:uncharacterized protein C8A04DRAFT_29656 [Dichotomopilus funicola]|uniref:Uncharacterized protein n=1 Tax=Dichotomopilus funicola TaxID=1934379 RepID=A0AAN6ZKJ9_9PEZI|nr:hypothetical protein C8A04DRAFT_29656 [Dichotomopilus funicola]